MKEKMKEEALRRMKKWNLHENVIREFKDEDKLNKSERSFAPGIPYYLNSERSSVPGILYYLNEEEKNMIKEWEAIYGGLVYHVIHDYTNLGELYTLLFVSKYEEEWEYDNTDIEVEEALCYVINKDYEQNSEFGHCMIRPANGGLERTA